MDKYEDTVVNPNISLNNFEVKVRGDIKERLEPNRLVTNSVKKDKNYQKSIILLVLLAAILVYQLSVSF